jgi:hypothetical protein
MIAALIVKAVKEPPRISQLSRAAGGFAAAEDWVICPILSEFAGAVTRSASAVVIRICRGEFCRLEFAERI